jgi:hypothetical protein
MSSQLENMDLQVLIQQAVDELGIDQPIMATKVVGGEIRIHMLGGRQVAYPIPDLEEEPRSENLGAMTKDELYDLASTANIKGRSNMSKVQLIQALKKGK